MGAGRELGGNVLSHAPGHVHAVSGVRGEKGSMFLNENKITVGFGEVCQL